MKAAPSTASFRALVVGLSALAVLALAVGIWFRREQRDAGAASAPAGKAEQQGAPSAELALPAGEARTARADSPPAKPAEASSPPAPPAASEETTPAPEPVPADLTATRPFHVLVVDEKGVGIADAAVRIYGMRSEADEASWYGYRGGVEPEARTDRDGKAELAHWVWVDQDGRTSAVDLLVEHPEYTPFRDSSVELADGPYVVTLRRGSTVVVSGWLRSPEQRIHDIVVVVDRESRLKDEDWTELPDGSRLTSQLTPGPHLLRVRHASEEHGQLFSEVHSFVLAQGDWQAFHLELHPGEVLQGRLDDAVPRPVREGHVQLCLHAGGLGGEPALASKHETAIAADGTFRFEGLPRGSGQVIALCSGWYSKRTLADTPEQAGVSFGAEPSPAKIDELMASRGDRAFIPQRVAVPQETTPFVIEMEAAGTLQIRVLNPDGAPLEGAFVGASPNVHYFGVGSTIVPWRTWSATTDETGTAQIHDLPPEPSLWISAAHAQYEMKRSDRLDNIAVEVRSGETNEVTIALEPKGQ